MYTTISLYTLKLHLKPLHTRITMHSHPLGRTKMCGSLRSTVTTGLMQSYHITSLDDNGEDLMKH